MKQPLLSLMKTQKLFSLTKSMTENSKNACWLLLSVILLTGTVTGIAGPLENSVSQMAEQTSFMRKELVLYRKFAETQTGEQTKVQQQDILQTLQEQMPEHINPEKEVQRIYRLASLHGITVQRCKRIPDGSYDSEKSKTKTKTGNGVGMFQWEAEFSGTWQDLMSFFSDIETQGPCTRMKALRIYKSGEKETDSVVPGTGRETALSVSGRVCVHYCKK